MPITYLLLQVARGLLIMATAAMLGVSLGWLEQSKQSKQWQMEDWVHDAER